MAEKMCNNNLNVSSYSHSQAHLFILLSDVKRLTKLLSTLPKLCPPSQIQTEADALVQSNACDRISRVVDGRDVPGGDTPLHLAVRLSNFAAANCLLVAGADPSLQNSSGWTPLQESLSLRRPLRISLLLLRHHRLSAFFKFRLRLPSLVSALHRMPNFYMELSFHFDATFVPFLSRAAPSDTYRMWKRGGDLRLDMTIAGFDGLKVKRAEQSFLFLEGSRSVVVVDRGRKEARDAFEGFDCLEDEMEEKDLVEDASAYRPGLDVTKAEVVGARNWRGREKVEMVGEWRARIYEMRNVVFSFKTMKAIEKGEEEEEEWKFLELDLDEEAEDGYIVAELPRKNIPARHSCYERGMEEIEVELVRRRKSLDLEMPALMKRRENVGVKGVKRKEKEMVKNLRPTVWLTEDFPLKTKELLPILDILANKVKAVRRLREVLTTKFPPHTFPVKVSIPVVPTVRVVITFSKFVNLQPTEQFFTPLSSPRHLSGSEEEEGEEDHRKVDNGGTHKSSWLKWGNNATTTTKTSIPRSKSVSPSQVVDHIDPFSIPSDYTWISLKDRSRRTNKSSKPNKGKQSQTL